MKNAKKKFIRCENCGTICVLKTNEIQAVRAYCDEFTPLGCLIVKDEKKA
jgi:hypothetical protein